MPYDINRARQSGATDDQIIDYLSSTRNYDYKGALNSGASKSQVIDYLSKSESPYIEKKPIQTPAQTADIRSAEETGALFPAQTGGKPLAEIAKTVGNVPSSLLNNAKNIAKAVISPIETVKGLSSFAGGALRTAGEKIGIIQDTEDTASEQTFDAIVENLKGRYGSLEAMQRTATNDPVGFGADVLSVVTGGAGAIGKLGKVTKGLEAVTEVAKAPIISKIATRFDDVAIRQMDKALNLNPSDVRKIKRPNVAGKNPSEWLLERDFTGNQLKIADDLDVYSAGTKTKVDEGLAGITKRFPAEEAQSARQILDVLKQTFSDIPGNEKLVSRLDNLRTKTDYDLTELNNIKRLVDSNLKIFRTTGDIKSGAISQGLANLRDDLKTFIEERAASEGFKEVKELNKETQVAKEIEESLRKRVDVQSKLPELGLRDAIVAAGGFAAGDPTFGLLTVAAKKTAESAAFRTYLANKLKSIGKKEIDVLNKAADAGNTELLINFYLSSLNEFQKSTAE